MKTKERILLDKYIERKVKDYMQFMNLDSFPDFKIISIQPSISESNKKGYGNIARQLYDIPTGKQTLEIWQDVYKSYLHADYILFHEFTHMLDAVKYSQMDSKKNAANKGYTEYHASQIELLRLLGAKSYNDTISFSMDEQIDTVSGKKTVNIYISNLFMLITKLITQDGFPSDLETLQRTIGMVFNYLGNRSICELYATDYIEDADKSCLYKFFTILGSNYFEVIDNEMHGFLDDGRIHKLDELYINLVLVLIKMYNLC